ncbi:MAG: amidohydrolase, partial [Bryobacteraceae bacterium]
MLRTFLLLLIAATAFAQTNVESGKRYARIVIRGAMVVDGSGTPASGPKDIVIENNMIADVVPSGGRRAAGDITIDASGKYVLPGLIDAHAHVQDERGGIPQPLDYELKIWLACGITTVRDVGSDTPKTLQLRKKSADGEVAS